jgi:hypothetical protein
MNISELERSLRQLRAATWTFIGAREDALFLAPRGRRQKPFSAGHRQAAIQQGYRMLYLETQVCSTNSPTQWPRARANSSWKH